MARLRIEIVTPRRRVLSEEVDEVVLPGVLGELGVLPGHTPLLTALGTGPLRTITSGRSAVLAVAGGFAEVLPERVTVLAMVAERPDEVDVEAARSELELTARELKGAAAEQLDELTERQRLAETRLAVAGGS